MATLQRRSGGPAPEAKCSPFLRAACLLSLTTVLVPWQLAAQAPPLDTATVRTLLVEAAEALDAVPEALVEAWFVDRLNELRASVDLPPIELPEPPEFEPDPLDVLIEAREWDAVERYIVAMEPGEDQNVARRRLVRTFIDEGLYERGVTLSERFNASGGTYWLLRKEELPAEERVSLVRGFMDEGIIRPSARYSAFRDMVGPLARVDREAAWALADSVPNVSWRVSMRLPMLQPLFAAGDPQADSLLRDTERMIHEIENPGTRTTRQHRLQDECERWEWEACTEFRYPPRSPADIETRAARMVPNAMGEGDFETARKHLDLWAQTAPPDRVALLALRSLAGPGVRCPPTSGCRPELERWILHWVDEGRRVAAVSERAVADNLRHPLSRLIAPWDAELALREAGLIRDPQLRRDAYAQIGASLLEIDVVTAWEAVKLGRGTDAAGRAARHLFLLFMSLDDTAAASEALELMGNEEAAGALLEWSRRMGALGRTDEARDWARAALERMPPPRWSLVGFPGRFHPYFSLGLHDEVIAWARSVEAPEVRAHALAEVARDGLHVPFSVSGHGGG